MKVINKETIRNGMNGVVHTVKKGISVIGPIAAALLLKELSGRTLEEIRYMGNVKYDDAVKAILNSNMWSGEKREAVAALKKGKNSDYYRAVINTVRSSMFSGDKLKMIQDISRKEEEES